MRPWSGWHENLAAIGGWRAEDSPSVSCVLRDLAPSRGSLIPGSTLQSHPMLLPGCTLKDGWQGRKSITSHYTRGHRKSPFLQFNIDSGSQPAILLSSQMLLSGLVGGAKAGCERAD